MRKILTFLFLCLIFISPVYAEEALLQADRETTPVLMPFRVWVLPKWENGSMISGHYEYFEMLMPREGLVLFSPELVPVIPTP